MNTCAQQCDIYRWIILSSVFHISEWALDDNVVVSSDIVCVKGLMQAGGEILHNPLTMFSHPTDDEDTMQSTDSNGKTDMLVKFQYRKSSTSCIAYANCVPYTSHSVFAS